MFTCWLQSIQQSVLSSNEVDLLRYSTKVDFFGIYFLQSRFLHSTCNEVIFFQQISTFYFVTFARKHVEVESRNEVEMRALLKFCE